MERGKIERWIRVVVVVVGEGIRELIPAQEIQSGGCCLWEREAEHNEAGEAGDLDYLFKSQRSNTRRSSHEQ